MKKLAVLMILLALLLCGCAKEAEVDPDAVDFAQTPTIPTEEVDTLPVLNAPNEGTKAAPHFFTAAENGIFTLKLNDGSWDKEFLHFYDFTTGESYPVCAKPNCTHDDYLCSAYLEDATFPHYDGNYLYYFTGTACQFWRMNTDGTDRKMLFECNEKAESGALMHIGSAIYLNGKVYFDTYGSMMDPVTLEITTGEHICVGDLETGEYSILPVKFQEDKGSSTLNLLGMYGDQLVVRHSNTLVTGIGYYQKNEETVCLLDVNTMEVTVLCQWQWDTNDDSSGVTFSTASIDEGYMIFKIYTDTYSHPTYADGTVLGVNPGDRLFVDLSEKKAYRMTDQDDLTIKEIVVDGKWIYVRWDEDHTYMEKAVRELATGEEYLLPEAVRDMEFNYSVQDVGEYYIVGMSGEDGWFYGYMPRADFWAGKQEITPLPEWMALA